MEDKKLVSLDIYEMGYLLETCLRSSHLRSDTIRRFVDEWYELFTKDERIRLFEWTIHLTYSQIWTSGEEDYKPHFEPSTTLDPNGRNGSIQEWITIETSVRDIRTERVVHSL